MLASLRRGGLRIYLIAREERVNTSGQPITITNEADRLARPYKTHDYIYIYMYYSIQCHEWVIEMGGATLELLFATCIL